MLENLSRLRRKVSRCKGKAASSSSRLFVELLEDRWVPTNVSWTGPITGGSFDLGTNWSTGNVPGAGDVASIGQLNGPVTAAGGEKVGELKSSTLIDVQGGTFTVQNTVDVSASTVAGVQVDSGAVFSTTGGTTTINAGFILNGTLSTSTGATVNFSSGSILANNATSLTGTGLYDVTGSANLDFTVANPAPTNFELDSGTISGTTLNIGAGATFTWIGGTLSPTTTNVAANGTVNMSNNATTILGASGVAATLNNAGTMTWSGSANWQINNGSVFNNSGTFTVSGDATIQEFGSGTSMVNNSGTFKKTSNANKTTIISCQFNNTNQLNISSGTLDIDQGGSNTGTINVTSTLLFDNGTFSVNSGSALNGAGTYLVNGGGAFLTFNLDISLANLTLTAGTVNGPNQLTISNQFNWNGSSTMGGSGKTVIPNGATMAINGSGVKILDTRTLNLAGTGTWSSTADWQINTGATFNNSGSFTINTDSNVPNFGSGTASINNSGTFIKISPSGSGITQIGPVLNNTGTLTITSGTLEIAGGGSNTGTINVAANQTLFFDNLTFLVNAGSALNGTGTYLVGNGGAVLSFDADTSLANLTLTSGFVTGPNKLTVTNQFTWNGSSTMNGTGTTVIPVGATMTISSSGTKVLDTRTVSLAGTGTWSGSADWQINTGATFNNSGTFTINTDQNIPNFGSGTASINNSGTFTKTSPGGSGVTQIGPVLNNTGTLTITTGTLEISGGGSNTGTISVAANQTLLFQSQTFNVNAGSALNGTGIYQVNGGGAIFAFNADTSLANLTLAQGFVTGPNKLTITNQFTWNGSNSSTMQGSGTTVIPGGATMTISGSGTKILDTRTLNLAGTGTWSGAADWQINTGAIFNNSGTFTISTDQTFQNFGGSGNSTINNSGTFSKTSPTGSGATLVNDIFNNTGTVTVTTGILDINDGGTDTGTTSVAAGQEMLFTGGTFLLNTGFALNGLGSYVIGNFTATVTANVNGSVTNLNLSSGVLSGSATFAVTGTFNWTGGTVGGATFVLNEPQNATFNLIGNTDKNVNGSTINLSGTTNWSGSGNISLSNSATINNQASGTFNVQNDQEVTGSGGSFVNAGTFTKSPTLGTTSVTQGLTFTNNGGTVNIQSGTFDLQGGYTQNAGTTSISQGATLISSNSHTITLTGGTLGGSGNVGSVSSATNVVNGGTVAPGGVGTSGTLTIAGNYTQGASGTLAIDLGGHTPGTQYDQLVITGTATFMAGGGTLSLTDINSFVPSNGDVYTVITFASATASFGSVGGPAVTSGFGFAQVVNAKNIMLQVSTTPGTLQFANALPVVNESAGTAVITVTRTGGSAGLVTVDYATSDGTGVAGTKYTATSGTLTFASGVTSQTFSVTLLNDVQIDGDETVNLTLSNATGAALGTPSTSQLTVEDENGTQVQRYVATVYWFILNRHVDAGGLQTWTNFVNGGGTRAQMVRTIENSTEDRQDEVKALYLKYLHRKADSGGLANFVNFIGNGGTVEQVAALLVGSTEYFSNRGGNTVTGFLNAIYLDALGRAPDSVGLNAFKLALSSGANNTAVATAIFSSTEYLDDDVNGYYVQFLRRNADPAGLANFASAIQNGSARDEDVIANLIGSTEFLNNLIGP
jgi:hypothetical protein